MSQITRPHHQRQPTIAERERMTAARTPSKMPDLFWHGSVRVSSSPDQPSPSLAVAKAKNKPAAPRHVLPKNLAAAVKQTEKFAS
jgi:hypothetical protein